MSSPRKQNSSFTLTPTEAKMLQLYRSGMTQSEVAAQLGWKRGVSIGSIFTRAAEKERLLNLQGKEIAHRDAPRSSLSKARGHIRMKGTK